MTYATYGKREVKLDLFSPTEMKRPRPAVILVHGGGWLRGNKKSFHPFAQAFASRGYVAATIEYRLGGEAKFPAAVHDCMAAVRWIRANHRRLNVDPKRIVAVGGSAGGHLVGLMATAAHVKALQGDGGHAGHSSAIQAAVVMAGPMVLDRGPVARRSREQPGKSNANKWFGKTVDQALELYRLGSPESHLAQRQSCPILFQTGDKDFPARNASMRNKLHLLRVRTGLRVYKDGKHGCWNDKRYRKLFVEDADAFFRSLSTDLDGVPFRRLPRPWGRIEFFSDRVELVLKRAAAGGQIRLPRLNNPIRYVAPPGKPPKKLALRPGIKSWSVRLPKKFNRAGQRFVVKTIGYPALGRADVVVVQRRGEIRLPAHLATVQGTHLRYEPQPHKNTVGYWTNPQDICRWTFFVAKPGKYDVVIFQGCGKGHGGSRVAAEIGKQRLEFTVEDTGHFQNFKDRKIGTVKFENPVTMTLTLRPIKKARVAVMDVRRVRLVPVGK